MIAAGAFHDQDVDLGRCRSGGLVRELGGLHDRLIVEIHVTRVENGLVAAAQQNAGGAEHMARVPKFEG